MKSYQLYYICRKFAIYLFCFLLFYSNSLRAFGNNSGKVSLKVDKVALPIVLEKLSEQSQVDMVYSDALVDSVFVSCDFSNITLDEALHLILKNTSISFKWVTNNRVVLVPLSSSQVFNISGYVLEAESAEALPFANISVIGTSRGTISNRQGRFALFDLSNRPCSLYVQYIGYLPKTVVLDPDTLAKNFQIPLQQTVYTTEKITVFAQKNEIIRISEHPSKLSISPRYFSNLPIIGDKDIFRSLQFMPGIINSSYGGANIHVRGGLPSENLIRFDGMTLYHIDHSFGFLSAFNVDAIKDVQVYKGGYPAKFGGRISGMIDMTAKTGNINKAGLKVGANQLSANFLVELPLFGKGALLVSGRRSFSSYLLESLYNKIFESSNNIFESAVFDIDNQPSDQLEPFADIFFYDFNGKLSYIPSKKDVVTLSFYRGEDDTRMRSEAVNSILSDTLTMNSDVYELKSNDKSNWGNRGYSVEWFRQWSPRFYSTTLAAYTDYFANSNFWESFSVSQSNQDSSNTDLSVLPYDLSQKNNLQDLSFRLENSWQLHPQHQLEFGTDISLINIKFQGENYFSANSFSQDKNTRQIAVFMQDNWQIYSDVDAIIGLRAIHNSLTRSQYWEPRLSARWQLTRGLSFKGAWGRYHQFIIQIEDMTPQAGGTINWVLADNQHFRAAFAEHRILGSQFSNKNFLFDIEYYDKKLKGISSFIPNTEVTVESSSETFTNQNSGYSRGIDFLFQKKNGYFTFFVSYGLNKTRAYYKSSGGTLFYPMNQDTPHNLKIGSNLQYKKWNFSATWLYASGKPYSVPTVKQIIQNGEPPYFVLGQPQLRNNRRLPSTHRLDIRLMYRFTNKYFRGNAGLSIFNLYNQENTWYRYFKIRDGKAAPVDVKAFGFKPTFNIELNF